MAAERPSSSSFLPPHISSVGGGGGYRKGKGEGRKTGDRK